MAKNAIDEPRMPLRQVVDLFIAMGCEPQEFPGQDVFAGADWQIYYLYSPMNDCLVDLTGLDMDDLIASSTIETWERALGVSIPRRMN